MKRSFQILSLVASLTLIFVTTTTVSAKGKGSGNAGRQQLAGNSGKVGNAGKINLSPNRTPGNLVGNSGLGAKIDPKIQIPIPGRQVVKPKVDPNLGSRLSDIQLPKLPGSFPNPNGSNSTPGNGKPGNGKPGNGKPSNGKPGNGSLGGVEGKLPGGLGGTARLPDLSKFADHRLPAVQLENILKKPQVSSPLEFQKAAACAPKFLTCHPHFNWWLTILIHHHHHWCGHWYYQDYCWDYWRPCYYTTVCHQDLSYYVGLNCVYIPDMRAYGVQSVVANSPAERAGLKSGDLIQSINGRPIDRDSVLNEEVSTGRLDMQLLRDGSEVPVPTTVIPQVLQTISN